jgi:hypothetical protein
MKSTSISGKNRQLIYMLFKLFAKRADSNSREGKLLVLKIVTPSYLQFTVWWAFRFTKCPKLVALYARRAMSTEGGITENKNPLGSDWRGCLFQYRLASGVVPNTYVI